MENLGLNDKQMSALDDALFVHTVEQQTRETDASLLNGMKACAITTLLKQRIAQGSSLGLKSKPDLSLFAVLSLQLPKGFEMKPPFVEAIDDAVQERSTLANALEKVTPDQWQAFEKSN